MALPREISCTDLSQWLNDAHRPRPTLVDVRRHDEWDLVHLEGALHFPLQELAEHEEELKALTGPVVVYCHHGVRSLSGAAFLLSLGVEATSLKGGIEEWAVRIAPHLPRY